VAQTHGGSTTFKSPGTKPLTSGTPLPPSAKKETYGASASIQPPTNQQADDKEKEANNKQVPIDPRP
jgi:hypothetical protein